jgi:hypothetical protein
MQLAESIPGPNGGYKPTTVAYNLIRLDNKIEPKSVEFQYNSGCAEIDVVDFNINNAENLTNCRIEIYIENDVEKFSNGDWIKIDIPTDPRLRIEGEIELLNPVTNQLLANVDSFLISTE